MTIPLHRCNDVFTVVKIQTLVLRNARRVAASSSTAQAAEDPQSVAQYMEVTPQEVATPPSKA